MRYRYGRRSICVSSQSGCPLTCTFCATGTMKFGRNLTASEILDQVLHFRRIEPVDHLVFMGMGEPMMNLDSVLAAARRLPDVGITHRRTTISTVGWVPGIRGADREPTCRSASRSRCTPPTTSCARRSCRSTTATRSTSVLEACRAYYARRRRRVFIEYVMLAGVNDTYRQAVALAELLDREDLQGQPDPVQPDRDVRRLLAGRDRRVQGRAGRARRARHRPPHPRPRHRRRLRASWPARTAGVGALRRRAAGGRAARSPPPGSDPTGRRRAAPRASPARTASGTAAWCGRGRRRTASGPPPRSARARPAPRSRTRRRRRGCGRPRAATTGCR